MSDARAKSGDYCEVAVALPVEGPFTYAIPKQFADILTIGHRVLVPFGHRKVTGYVINIIDETDLETVKPIHELLDLEAAFDETRLALFQFVSDYYMHPLGEVIKTGLPAGINLDSKKTYAITEQGEDWAKEPGISVADRRVLMSMVPGKWYTARQLFAQCDAATSGTVSRLLKKEWVACCETLSGGVTKAKFANYYRPAEDLDVENAMVSLSRAPKQRQVLQFLLDVCCADSTTVAKEVPTPAQALSALVEKGLIIKSREEKYRDVECGYDAGCDAPFELNPHQQNAVDAIGKHQGNGSFSPFLIHGVTGSGKTEVYMRLAETTLQQGKSSLVLVPEIALTPQLVSRFHNRFGKRVAVSHSGLSDSQRYDQWRRMLRGEADLCIGTRSAIFAPLENLGLVVVDEEHDASYKQDDGVPYNARDLSMVLGKTANAVVVLGSATPSLESYKGALEGRYTLLNLPERATAGHLPVVEVVDLAAEIEARRRTKPNTDDENKGMRTIPSAPYALTKKLEQAIEQTLAEQEQGILFLNRRGFSHHAFCLECRKPLMCPNCAVSLTVHRGGRELRCHYCDHRQMADVVCPHCGGVHFYQAGIGTEQLESKIEERFPGARIVRLDRDTTERKGALEKILTDFSKHRYDLLVGTQIVTKGHDFPNVTLVGVLSADSSMHLPDFRSGERTFQMLSQVAGRAGRGDKPGRVVVQTFNPEHYSIQAACEHDYESFYKLEAERRTFPAYPPYARIAIMRARSQSASKAKSFLLMVANSLRQYARERNFEKVMVLGPSESPLAKIKNNYRFQMLIKGQAPSVLLTMTRQAAALAEQWKHQGVTWRIDIDPQNVL